MTCVSFLRRVLPLSLLLLLAAGAPQAASLDETTSAENRGIVHLLNRIGYGPRPGDVERVRSMGVPAYIEEQLHPETIDDASCEEKLSGLKTLGMSIPELLREYPKPEPKADTRDEKPRGMENNRRPAVIIMELAEAKMIRAVHSERQLQEVMTDFWFNHFNVNAAKDAGRWLATSYERDAIRPHALGRFRELLGATAKHPAMLFYLDNYQSVKPGGGTGRRRGGETDSRPRGPRGLNENYGRELMELHTLGVDGGYTQRDVTEVSRCFTGWTIDDPRKGGSGSFLFRGLMHDEGSKVVLGVTIAAGGGQKDGEQVLDMLASHPKTAAFISRKLVNYFVSDTPSPALVKRTADVFRKSGGDIREVVRLIITSPEFNAAGSWRAKIKKPFELVASTLRITGASTTAPNQLPRVVGRIGEPLYQCEPPTGYPSHAAAWVNTGALLNRMNFALAFAGRKIPGVTVSLKSAFPDAEGKEPGEVLEMMIGEWLGGSVSSITRQTLETVVNDPELRRARLDDRPRNADMVRLAALVLGSPEFQRR